MKSLQTKLIGLAGYCLVLAGCAQTGPPLPPSLELPKPPPDLRATRKGDTVTLMWSEPALTTDRQSVRYLGPTMICRSAEREMTVCGNAIEIVPPPAGAGQKPNQKAESSPVQNNPARDKQGRDKQAAAQTYVDRLPASAQSEDPDAEITYAVEVLNRNARGAGVSNRVRVPAIAALAAPSDVVATLTGDGVLLTWTSSGERAARPGVKYRYRIYRHTENAGSQSAGKKTKDDIAGEIAVDGAGPARFLDAIEWEKTYQYRITGVTIISRAASEVQVEGDDSAVVRVVAHDVFPPNVPAGLQAVYSGAGQKAFVDLIWAPVTSADLAGYNVYRSEGAGAAVKLNSELIQSPAYRDSAVGAGKVYVYSVSAVDLRGNESAHSDEASESVP